MSCGLSLLIKANFFIIINVYYQAHIPLNNLIRLALGPPLIKSDYHSVQILKNENSKQYSTSRESIWAHKTILVHPFLTISNKTVISNGNYCYYYIRLLWNIAVKRLWLSQNTSRWHMISVFCPRWTKGHCLPCTSFKWGLLLLKPIKAGHLYDVILTRTLLNLELCSQI